MMWTWCPECGPSVRVDEDGCCLTCGATATGSAVDAAVAAAGRIAELDVEVSRRGDLVQDERRLHRREEERAGMLQRKLDEAEGREEVLLGERDTARQTLATALGADPGRGLGELAGEVAGRLQDAIGALRASAQMLERSRPWSWADGGEDMKAQAGEWMDECRPILVTIRGILASAPEREDPDA